jgi:Protein of unknown function (DUF3152)
MSYDRWPPSPDTAPRPDIAPHPVRPHRAPQEYSGHRDYSGYGPRVRRRAARRRAQQRRRRVLAVLILVMLVGTVGFLLMRSAGESTPQTQSSAGGSPSGNPASSTGAKPAPTPQNGQVDTVAAVDPASVPQSGPGTFAYATGTGKVLGAAGTLRKFQVAVEKDTGQDADAFAASVDRVLGDPRGWTATGKNKFQRVPSGTSHDFVIYLATPATSEKMCAAGGLHTDKYTSCRLPGQVIINLARWLSGVPGYGAPLDVYQAYALNHELGHQLGLFHEACPGPGQTAPVMQQQTLGLDGCVANGWPYVGGVRVTGPPVP